MPAISRSLCSVKLRVSNNEKPFSIEMRSAFSRVWMASAIPTTASNSAYLFEHQINSIINPRIFRLGLRYNF